MSRTHVTTTITIGDDPPQVRTYEASPPALVPFAVIGLGGSGVYIHTADQAYALIGAFREAARFLEGADPGDLRTTTEAEADFQAAQARAELARS